MKEKLRHVSKKNKASWRKNIDITDVEEFLEEQRQDERIGNLADKSDAELFSSDVKPNSETSKLKNIRHKMLEKNPKFCLPLENTSKVQDPVARRNVITNKTKISKKLVKAEKLESKFSAGRNSRTNKKHMQDTYNRDIWSTDTTVPAEMNDEWFNPNVVLHHMKNSGKPIVKIAASTHTKPNAVPNIEMPASGTSYNPSVDDYNELKQKVIEEEQKKMKRSTHLDRVVTHKFSTVSKEERDALVMKEMSEGLFETADYSASDDSGNEVSSINPAVQNKKKTRSARNKQFRTVTKRAAEVFAKTEVKKIKDINRLHELSTELDKSAKKTSKKQENRAKRLEEKKLMPGRVAYLQYEEPEKDFIDPTELSGNLRNLVSSKSLVADRFKSFQKRNLIAPKKHRDGISRSNKSTNLKKWKRYTLSTHKETE